MKHLLTITIITLSAFAHGVLGADYAVTFYQGDATGIPDGWPATKRELAQGEQPLPGEVFVTEEALAQIIADRATAMDARKARLAIQRSAPTIMAEALRQRIAQTPFQELRNDAALIEQVEKLADAFVRLSRLTTLLMKAIQSSALTNNLTAGERALAVTIRNEIAFGDGSPVTTNDINRFVTLRNGVLHPRLQLFRAAQAVIRAWETNAANAPDPYATTNLPNVVIAE